MDLVHRRGDRELPAHKEPFPPPRRRAAVRVGPPGGDFKRVASVSHRVRVVPRSLRRRQGQLVPTCPPERDMVMKRQLLHGASRQELHVGARRPAAPSSVSGVLFEPLSPVLSR